MKQLTLTLAITSPGCRAACSRTARRRTPGKQRRE
jgi:hypothetical protein